MLDSEFVVGAHAVMAPSLRSLDSETVDETEIDDLWSAETRRVSLRLEYHELVDTDLEHAWTWSEDQERGLGDRFLDAILATVVRA